MFRRNLVMPGMVAVALAGCGDNSSKTAAEAPLHGGTIVTLPDNRGVAELLTEVKRDAPGSTLVVYFVQPDMKSALSPPPRDVRLKILLGRKDTIVRLAPDPVAGDPLASGRFVAPPGNYPWDSRENELIASIDGQSVSVPFRPAR